MTISNAVPDDAKNQVRCAFCLNSPAANQVKCSDSDKSSYLCDDCFSVMEPQRRFPKFTQVYDDERKIVIEIEIDPADQGKGIVASSGQGQPPPPASG